MLAIYRDFSPHPWVRYFARQLDFYLADMVVRSIYDIDLEFYYMLVYYFFIIIAWLVVESVLLSTWGYTPGKRLLNISVRSEENEKLELRAALKRSFRLWLYGLGIGVPLVMFVALILAYRKLVTVGQTEWDRMGQLTVLHGGVGAVQISALVVFFVAYNYFF